MSVRRPIGGEGESTPWSLSAPGPAAGLVVCPMLTAGVGVDATTVQDIYRLAYEWARAASRPSAYEMALKASCN
jgi:hypothetical protein